MTPQYENAPLREAVCEFRFIPGSPWDAAIPGLFYSTLSDVYPKRVPVPQDSAGSISVEVPADRGFVLPNAVVEELRFWREDEDGVIRLRPHTLSVSHYRPYRSWEEFRPEVEQILAAYRKIGNPSGIERIGLRYINDFDFDGAAEGTRIDIEDYFQFAPAVGPTMRQDMANFSVAVHYLFEENRDTLRVQMQPMPSGREGIQLLRLDLDYFLNQPGQVSFEAVSGWLDFAHAKIHETFESCLKDEIRKRMGGGI